MHLLTATSLGKRFGKNQILNNISFALNAGDKLAITGLNGSGKSTLLQILAGYLSPSQGKVEWTVHNTPITRSTLFHHISFASPYLELIEDFTLKELFSFYFSFKKTTSLSLNGMVALSTLESSAHKPIKEFSSGMKQRVKLTLALCSQTPFVFLDEPFSNLDSNGIEWYKTLLAQNAENKVIVICSNNIAGEIELCNKHFSVNDVINK